MPDRHTAVGKLGLAFTMWVVVILFSVLVHATPPNPVSSVYTYQGAIFVDDLPFNDTGLFKLAIVNQDGVTAWSNDGTSVDGSEPSGDIAVAVDQGVFFILLGDNTTDGMSEIDSSIFATDDTLFLKTWFSDGSSGFSEMTPAIELTASSFAINSQYLRGYGPDDFFLNSSQITSSQIAAGAVGTTQIAGNSITGDKITAFSNNNTDFTVGRGVDENVQIIASTGAASEPGLRYDSTTDAWQFSNDGTVWNNIGSGGGSGTVNVGAINELAYYAAAGDAVSGLATGNNGVLITSAGGVPSISSTLPGAVQGNITSVGTIGSGTWQGNAVADGFVADNLTISGGTVNNSIIGGTAPLAGTFRGLIDELDTAIQGGDLTIGLGTTAYAGRIVLHDADAGDSFTTTLQSNANVPASFSLILPADDGNASEVLTTDGSGNLSWSAVSGGDVVGPAVATDNAITRFDTATGKLIQNSGVIIDDSNNVTGVAALSIASMGQNWTNAGRTVADLGTVTTANIDGGTIDNVSIGQGTAGLGTFTDLVASTLLVGTVNQGDILYDNGTTFVRLTPGTSGQFLQTQGAGADPVWASQAADAVTSVFTRTGAVTAQANDYTWAQIDKTVSSLADLTTRSAGDLLTGNLNVARMPLGGAWTLTSNLDVDGDTLVVDATNHRVGINTAAPGTSLHVTGTIRATSGFSSNNGTVGSPSHYFTSDTNTGLFRPAADTLGVTTGGAERIRFDSSGALIADQGGLRFGDADSSNFVAFQAPALVGSDVTWTLPSADGTGGQVLQTNGGGVLSWVSGGTGTVNSGNADEVAYYAAGGTAVSGTSTLPNAVQDNITRLGTVTTGTWNATAIDETHGGTNQTTYTVGDLLYASVADTLSKLAIGSGGDVLTVAGGVPTWAAPSTDAPADATYITQTSNATLTNEQAMDALATGLMQVTTGTGVVSSVTDSAGVAALISDETGTGALVFGTSPTLGTPDINTPDIDGGAIDSATLNSSAIGGTTPAAAAFTTLSSSGQYTNTVTDGTTPMLVTSTTLVNNLNADRLDSQEGSYYLDLANANITGEAQGDVLYFDGANWARLGFGTSGQFLQTQGTGANPVWATPAGSGTVNVGAINQVAYYAAAGAAVSGTSTLPSLVQGNITEVGTIGTGTWQGTAIAADQGGTGQTAYTVGDVLYADTVSSIAKLAGVATGNSLISGGVGAAPSWGKVGLATHVSGTLPIGNGGTGATTAAAARGNLSAAASGANSDITSLSGLTTALSIAQGGTGQTAQTAAFDALSPTTTKGDLIVDNGTNDIRLPVGTDDQVLVADSGEASGVKWADAGSGDVVGPAGGATDNAIARYDTTTGKLIQDSLVIVNDTGSVNIPTGQSYQINGSALTQDDVGDGTTYKQYDPSSAAITGGSITGITDLAVADGGTGASDAATARSNLGAAASGANSDITSLSGLTTALSVAQGGSGATDAATARSNFGAAASGANSDITSLSGLTTALSETQGGTGLGAYTVGDILYSDASNSLAALAIGSSGEVLTVGGSGTPEWSAAASGTVTSVGSGDGLSGGPITGAGTLAVDSTVVRTTGAQTVDSKTMTNVAITSGSISGITDLAVADGGTGASDAATARSNLSAAASGANSDITSLSGLTTPLSVPQGGSGAATLTGFLVGNGAAAFSAVAAIPGADVTGDIAGNAANVTGTVAIANGGTGQTTQTAAFDALSPTTTKGDLIVDNGTNDIRLPVGTDDQVLVADSAEAAGVKWATNGNTLDQAYDQGGAGVGRTITADTGPVEITGGTRAPLRLVPGSAPNSNLADGQIYYDTASSMLYVYDGSRSKWLSVTRQFVGWGRNSASTTNEYLRQFNGALSSNNGWRMMRNGTITGISAQGNANQTWTFEIRKNDAAGVITSITMTAVAGNHNPSINVDFSAGDFIQSYCNGTAINYPQGLIEIAWRP